MTDQHTFEEGKSRKSALVLLAVLSLLVIVASLLYGDYRSLGAASGSFVSGAESVKRSIRIPQFQVSSKGSIARPAIAHINTDPVLKLVDALEQHGAKVSLSESTVGEFSTIQIGVDGKALPPFVSECLACEVIIFEY